MKTILFSVGALIILVLLVSIAMALMSQKEPSSLGLKDNMLQPCPDSPNCVCSESISNHNEQHFIKPLATNMAAVKQIIIQQGGKIKIEQESYIHATFTTPVFSYVDDVELRYDKELGITHIRSASRMGSSDFGVNRKRVEGIQKLL